jgi:hypothetical protein
MCLVDNLEAWKEFSAHTIGVSLKGLATDPESREPSGSIALIKQRSIATRFGAQLSPAGS